VPEFCPFDVAYTRLRDSHGPGYVLLGEATLHAQPSELIDRQASRATTSATAEGRLRGSDVCTGQVVRHQGLEPRTR